DRLYLEGARNPRVMAIAVHPYIHGVPHRIKYFEAAYDYIRKHRGVWLTTGEEIYEWYKRTAQSSEPPPRRVACGTARGTPRATGSAPRSSAAGHPSRAARPASVEAGASSPSCS